MTFHGFPWKSTLEYSIRPGYQSERAHRSYLLKDPLSKQCLETPQSHRGGSESGFGGLLPDFGTATDHLSPFLEAPAEIQKK